MRISQPTRVLYCIDGLLRGGTELQLIGLIQRLDRTRYTPYLLTIRSNDIVLPRDLCAHLSWDVPRLLSVRGLKSLVALVQFLRRERIDVVHTFFQDSTLLGGLAGFLARTRVRIASFRDLGFWLTLPQRVAMRSVCATMTGFICNADVVRDHFSTALGIPLREMTVVRNGADADALPFVERHGPCRNVCIVANLTRHVKRVDLFIRAAALLRETHPDLVWHVIGDGHLREEMNRLAGDLCVTDRIVFAGRISEIPEYFEQMDIGVICSDSEGLSNALIEYMFKGVAVVATRVGGNPELVTHMTTGVLVPPDDAAALAQAIAGLAASAETRRTLVENARRQVATDYSWQLCLRGHDACYGVPPSSTTAAAGSL